MFCTNCGKSIQPDNRFCPHCGSGQAVEAPAVPLLTPALPPPAVPASAPAPAAPLSGGKPALWAGGAAVVLALVGGVGYWGWSNKVAGDEAAQKLVQDEAARMAATEESTRKLAGEAQRRLAAEKAAEAAEIVAAQAMLDKHIAAEEAEVQANAQGAGKAKAAAPRR